MFAVEVSNFGDLSKDSLVLAKDSEGRTQIWRLSRFYGIETNYLALPDSSGSVRSESMHYYEFVNYENPAAKLTVLAHLYWECETLVSKDEW